MIGDHREGPTVQTKTTISCRGCKFLTTETSYGSNDYEEIDYACSSPGHGSDRNIRLLPMSCDQTPAWCPYWPESEPKPTMRQLQ